MFLVGNMIFDKYRESTVSVGPIEDFNFFQT